MKVKTTEEFNKWIKKLKDKRGVALIVSRLKRVEEGHLGEYKSIGSKVCELKINSGPGYRVYIYRTAKMVIVLNAGSKGDQQANIKQANKILKEILS